MPLHLGLVHTKLSQSIIQRSKLKKIENSMIQKLLHPELSSSWNKSFKWVLGVTIRKFTCNGSYIEEVCGFIVALGNDIKGMFGRL